MPWKETWPMKEREWFVRSYEGGEDTLAYLCRIFEVSRKTGHKWLKRYRDEGIEGLRDRSRAPLRHPNAVGEDVVEAIVRLRELHTRWGPKKLLAWQEQNCWAAGWPSLSTIGAILKRRGLVKERRRRKKVEPYSNPFKEVLRANDVWSADFKGWFRTGDGRRCDPLTIADVYSRYMIRCEALAESTWEAVRRGFERSFIEYGLPWGIRTDNGTPFASRGLGGLSRLSVWWIKLGIRPERISLGKPAENGRHERMHRTLSEETASPPKGTIAGQQAAFDAFREHYNHERPHEALGQRPPVHCYTRSERGYPARIPKLEYPEGMRVYKVSTSGGMSWKGMTLHLGEVLAGETIGLSQRDDRYWRIYLGPVAIAWLDDHQAKLLHRLNKSVTHVLG